jgi:MerR family transcriptional regulator, mercuric resistance operon regulatory protein
VEIAIRELSRRTQCNIETIRYYERIGLLPKPRRAGGRYRRYDDEDVARLRFIRRARQLGFTLDDIRAFMKLTRADGREMCNKAQDLTSTHIADIRAKIADLRATERVLSNALGECESGQRADCPIIEVLSRD